MWPQTPNKQKSTSNFIALFRSILNEDTEVL